MILLFAMLTWPFFQPTVSAQVLNSNFSKKIKTIDNYKINPNSGDKIQVSSEHFDSEGKLTKSITYNSYPDGDKQEQNCTYDARGNTKCITTDSIGKQTYFYEKRYAGKNIIEEKNTYNTTKYTYDKNDNLIFKEEYDSEGNFSDAEKHELIYSKGTTELQSITTFKKRGNGEFKKYAETYYTFDEGRLQEETEINVFGRYEYHYEYFSNGNLKEKLTLQGTKEKIITRYHENGNRRVEAIFRSEDADSEKILQQKNKWTYDEYGNEIMVESFRNDELISKRTREITYY